MSFNISRTHKPHVWLVEIRQALSRLAPRLCNSLEKMILNVSGALGGFSCSCRDHLWVRQRGRGLEKLAVAGCICNRDLDPRLQGAGSPGLTLGPGRVGLATHFTPGSAGAGAVGQWGEGSGASTGWNLHLQFCF